MMNKISKILIRISPFLLLFLVSLIPVYYTWGKLAIGGDVVLPFNPEGVEKFLWQWWGSGNGQYLTQNLAPLYLIYKISGYFALSSTAVSAIIFFSLNFLSGIAIYKLCKLIFNPKNTFYLSFPVIFYLISPAVLNGWHYSFIYAFAPWFIYFVTKIFITRKMTVVDIILANIVIFFASVDLPNPKYLFFLYLFAFAMTILALLLKIIDLKSIARNWWKMLLFFIYSLYLLIPLVFFAFNYSPENYGVHTRQNYADSGRFMDQGSTTIDKMPQLHHSGVNINANERINYNVSQKIIFAGSVFFICILLGLFFREKKPKFNTELIFLIMACLYLFFAVGPNPPLGSLYMALVSNFNLLAFLRTTAGAVFFLSIFYSVLLFGFIENFEDKYKLTIFALLFAVLLVSSYPLINGSFYKNLDVVGNRAIDRKSYGLNLPAEYFQIKEVIDRSKIDGKLLNLKSNLSYINTDWGYFGPNIYNFLFNYYNIGFNNILSKPENHSVAYILDDKSLIVDKTKPVLEIDKTTLLADNNVLSLSAVSSDGYLPHFWIPTKSYKKDQPLGDLSQVSDTTKFGEAIYLDVQNKLNRQSLDSLPEITESEPNLEYKKINPTKYRVVVHGAKSMFPLIFNETFDRKWKIYLENYDKQDIVSLSESLNSYIQFESNDNFQATKEEINNYVDLGLISRLESAKESKISKSDDGLDFISKEMSGTIQNDNMLDGSFFETWFQKPLLNDKRLVANGYANSWLIDSEHICKQSNRCLKNSDGSYDFELVVEFLPQRIFWIGLFISIISIAISLFFITAKKLISAKRNTWS